MVIKITNKDRVKTIVALIVIIILFFIVSYIASNNSDYIQTYLSKSYIGALVFILLMIAESVIVPVNPLPLVPVASAAWGWFIAGCMILIGWTIGSLVAFIIARKFGRPIIEKKYKSIEKIKKYVPDKHVFFGIILLRIAAPFDIMSYAIGLFSDIDWKRYTLASFIGYIPFTFIVAYLGSSNLGYQISLTIISISLIVWVFYRAFVNKTTRKKIKRRMKHKWKKKFKK